MEDIKVLNYISKDFYLDQLHEVFATLVILLANYYTCSHATLHAGEIHNILPVNYDKALLS